MQKKGGGGTIRFLTTPTQNSIYLETISFINFFFQTEGIGLKVNAKYIMICLIINTDKEHRMNDHL